MAIEITLALLPTALMIVVAAAILWAAAYLMPLLFARYSLTAYRSSVPLLQAIVFVGGIAVVNQFISSEAATMVAVILAMLWCGATAHDLYRFMSNRTEVAPSSGLRITKGPSALQRSTAQIATGSTASTINPLPHERLATEAMVPTQTTAPVKQTQVPSISFAKWLDLSPLPKRQLTRRAWVGKQTTVSFRFIE